MLPSHHQPQPPPHLLQNPRRTEDDSHNTGACQGAWGGTLGFLERLQAPSAPLPSGGTGTGPGLPAGDEKARGSRVGMGE